MFCGGFFREVLGRQFCLTNSFWRVLLGELLLGTVLSDKLSLESSLGRASGESDQVSSSSASVAERAQALQADTTEEHSITTITIVSAQFPTLCGHPPVTHTDSESDGDSSDSVFYTRTSSSENTTSSPLRPSSSLLATSSPLGPSSSPFGSSKMNTETLIMMLKTTPRKSRLMPKTRRPLMPPTKRLKTRRPLMPSTKSLETRRPLLPPKMFSKIRRPLMPSTRTKLRTNPVTRTQSKLLTRPLMVARQAKIKKIKAGEAGSGHGTKRRRTSHSLTTRRRSSIKRCGTWYDQCT